MPLYRETTQAAPAYLTYNYDGELVFVKGTCDYDEALDIARSSVPPTKDRHVAHESIILSITVSVGHKRRKHAQVVRISRDAWPSVIPQLAAGEVVVVDIQPDADCPPQYSEVGNGSPQGSTTTLDRRQTKQLDLDEKSWYHRFLGKAT